MIYDLVFSVGPVFTRDSAHFRKFLKNFFCLLHFCYTLCDILTSSTKHTEPHSFYIKYKRLLHINNIGDYTFHELRHTFATQCVDKGFDIKSLSMILGHSSVNTTMNLYVHPTLQMQKRQMELLDPINYSPSK